MRPQPDFVRQPVSITGRGTARYRASAYKAGRSFFRCLLVEFHEAFEIRVGLSKREQDIERRQARFVPRFGNCRVGLTLVESLVVIAIVALLVALTLPAVQRTREMARRIQCANNYRQISLAILQHSSAYGEELPSQWHAMFAHQPWRGEYLSWRYTILPFMEAQATFDALSSGKWSFSVRSLGGSRSHLGRVAAYQCPSSVGDPFFLPNKSIIERTKGEHLSIFDAVATHDNVSPWQILSISTGVHVGAWHGLRYIPLVNGIPQQSSLEAHLTPARLKYVTDGLSKTILLGEASHNAQIDRDSSRATTEAWFLGGVNAGDHGIGATINRQFGDIRSPHPGGAHAAMCDGSVQFLPEVTSETVLGAMLGRQDN